MRERTVVTFRAAQYGLTNRIRYLDSSRLLPLVTGSMLPLAQPLGGYSLLPLDILGDVGESPQTLPQRDRPAGEKGCQRATEQKNHQYLYEVSRLYHGEDGPDDDENDAANPDDDQHSRPLRL
jgi:hypothetical protein